MENTKITQNLKESEFSVKQEESWDDAINSCLFETIPQGCGSIIEDLIKELKNNYSPPKKL